MFAVHDIVQKIGTRACLSVKYVGLDPFACRLVLNGTALIRQKMMNSHKLKTVFKRERAHCFQTC